MKILVIGGAGYIGSHVTFELCDNGYDVVVLDDLSTGFKDNIDTRSNFIKDSFTNKNVLEQILEDIDCVIHLAALKAAGESMHNPSEYSKHNIINTIDLINCCIDKKVKNFIFSSSAAVYGYPEYLPIDENHNLNPINYYGFTKLIIEQQLLWYNKLKGLNVACLRYFNAAGFDIKGRVKHKENKPQNLLPIVMEVAAGIRDKMYVFGDNYDTPDGTCLRDYIHVNDLAKGHVKAIERLTESGKIVTNLATGNCHSVFDVIKSASKITKKNIKFDISVRRDGDPYSLYACSNNYLNFECLHSDLDTIIKTMWEIYRN